MKNRIFLFVMIILTTISCKDEVKKVYGPRPVKVQKIESLESIEKIYSGMVAPDQFSNLAFKVSGPLVNVFVDVGGL